MQLSDLKILDPSYEVIVDKSNSVEITGISNAIKPEPNTFIFIKNAKFLKSLGRLSNESEFLKTGIIFEEKYYNSIKDSQELKETVEKFLWAAKVDNVNFSMCVFSKPFYDKLYGELNYHIDGRQLNLAQVDVDAEIAQNVFIGSNVKIGKGTVIMSGAVIMPNAEIGDNSIIYPNTVIYPYSKIGNYCRIHSGAVIGADGFGYNFFKGEHLKVWHLSGVIIEDHVEIGANSTIDAGAFIPTKIGEGTKIDNFVQIGHNCQVGKHNVLAAQAGFAGSSESDDYCAFGAGAGLAPGARVGKGCQFAARTIVSENAIIEPGQVLAGHPARPLREWLKSQAKIRQLIK